MPSNALVICGEAAPRGLPKPLTFFLASDEVSASNLLIFNVQHSTSHGERKRAVVTHNADCMVCRLSQSLGFRQSRIEVLVSHPPTSPAIVNAFTEACRGVTEPCDAPLYISSAMVLIARARETMIFQLRVPALSCGWRLPPSERPLMSRSLIFVRKEPLQIPRPWTTLQNLSLFLLCLNSNSR